jgi:hypothetical protein
MTQELNDTKKKNLREKGRLAILRLIPGAGVTPAQGSVKPRAGFTFNKEKGRPYGAPFRDHPQGFSN